MFFYKISAQIASSRRSIPLLGPWATCCASIVALVFSWASIFAAPAQANQLDVIIDRTSYGVEVFITVPAELAEPIFGLPPRMLADGAGHIAFERLRLGTSHIGDHLFSRVSAHVGGTSVPLEAMSLMVHEATDPLPFAEPFDGLLAIELCTTEPPDRPVTVNDVRLYAGFVAYTDTPYDPLDLTLPNADFGAEVSVSVRSFRNGVLHDAWQTNAAPGVALVVPAVRPYRRTLVWMLAVTATAIGLIVVLLRSRFGDGISSTHARRRDGSRHGIGQATSARS